MNKIFAFCAALFTVLLTGIHFVSAQEATDTPDAGWPVEKHCVGEPTKPPKDWSYDGTIIVDDNYEIHGLNSDLNTAYFIGYGNNNFHSKGDFSPNGKWYAVPSGTIDRDLSQLDWGYDIDKINVYSTDYRQSVIHLNWHVSYRGASDMGQGLYAVTPMHWVDDSHLIYESDDSMTDYKMYRIDPFTDEKELLKTPFTSQKFHRISPDFKRTVYDFHVLDFSSGREINSLPESTLPSLVFWRPDSSGFVTVTTNNTNILINLYNQNGEFNGVIYDVPIESFSNIRWQWASDANQFAFVLNNTNLLIGTVSDKKIINLCISASGFAFSPDNTQLTYGYYSSKGDQLIAVMNMKSGVSYIRAYYFGDPIKWIAN